MAEASKESPPPHSTRGQPPPLSIRSPMRHCQDMEEETSLCHVAATTVRNVPSVKEGSKRTEILSTSKNQSSHKLMQVQRARPRSKESANAVKTRKRKIVARSAEDEATSLTSRESNSELSRYLTENCENITDDFDLLMWWRCNSSKCPILSKLAKDIIAVPVSTVASESSFSTGGRILDSFRTSLSATTVEALICTQSWLRSPSGPIDIIKSMEEIEAYEKIQEELLENNIMDK